MLCVEVVEKLFVHSIEILIYYYLIGNGKSASKYGSFKSVLWSEGNFENLVVVLIG